MSTTTSSASTLRMTTAARRRRSSPRRGRAFISHMATMSSSRCWGLSTATSTALTRRRQAAGAAAVAVAVVAAVAAAAAIAARSCSAPAEPHCMSPVNRCNTFRRLVLLALSVPSSPLWNRRLSSKETKAQWTRNMYRKDAVAWPPVRLGRPCRVRVNESASVIGLVGPERVRDIPESPLHS